jgi:hypothetical protein
MEHNTYLNPDMGKKADLRGALLSGHKMSGLNLNGADLRGAFLDGADLTGADLTGADLTGAGMEGATLKGTKFNRANLTNVSLRRTNTHEANFEYATMNGQIILSKVISFNNYSHFVMGFKGHSASQQEVYPLEPIPILSIGGKVLSIDQWRFVSTNHIRTPFKKLVDSVPFEEIEGVLESKLKTLL